MRKMMGIKDAAKEFGMSARCLRELVLAQKVAAIKSGKKYIVNTDSLNAYLDTQFAEANPPSKKTDNAKTTQFTPIAERV